MKFHIFFLYYSLMVDKYKSLVFLAVAKPARQFGHAMEI